jgi:hypothetical protein
MYVSIPDTAVAAVGTYHVLVVCAVWHPQVHNTTSVQPLCALSENRARPQIFVHTAAKRTLCAPQSTRSLSTITMCIFGDNTHLFVAHRAQIGTRGWKKPRSFSPFSRARTSDGWIPCLLTTTAMYEHARRVCCLSTLLYSTPRRQGGKKKHSTDEFFLTVRLQRSTRRVARIHM